MKCCAFAGTTSSFVRSFTTSATNCRIPSGPTRFGPLRTWRNASVRRSMYVRTPAAVATRITTTTALTAGIRKYVRTLCGDVHDYLSTSPRTMSIVPMIATRSDTMWPRAISGSAWRLMKLGGRTRSRYGLLPPFETR